MKRYGRTKCPFCPQMLTTNGLGYVSHMRKHVRSGAAIEVCIGVGFPYEYEPNPAALPASGKDGAKGGEA
jgi:hypothetical protein